MPTWPHLVRNKCYYINQDVNACYMRDAWYEWSFSNFEFRISNRRTFLHAQNSKFKIQNLPRKGCVMSVLSAETQKQVEDALVKKGLLTAAKLKELKTKAEKQNTPFFSLLVTEGQVSNEDLTKTIAKVNNIPYVNLSGVIIDAEVLALLPRETAERYMAVPLGEMQKRLVVAMLDADNVQAVDFLSNKMIDIHDGCKYFGRWYANSDIFGADPCLA